MVLDADGLLVEAGADEDAAAGEGDVSAGGDFAKDGVRRVFDGWHVWRTLSGTGLITAERRPVSESFVGAEGVVDVAAEVIEIGGELRKGVPWNRCSLPLKCYLCLFHSVTHVRAIIRKPPPWAIDSGPFRATGECLRRVFWSVCLPRDFGEATCLGNIAPAPPRFSFHSADETPAHARLFAGATHSASERKITVRPPTE